MTDLNRYHEWMVSQNKVWEEKCFCCGSCCGSLEDPCENLQKGLNGKFYCSVYDKRLGEWRTISGQVLRCVPIRDKIAQGHSWPGDEHCGYK
ncbi:MAG: hypothetical protein HQL13_04515 [Candidatus Omnitrophica bacterium]|nr:hypothetical protein [Candidatus Omnitrophota bacterium]